MHRGFAVVVFAAAPVLAASPVFASAFELRESSAGAMGTAYAGAAAGDSTPGDLFYNPAALAGVEDWDMSVNGAGLLLSSSGNFAGQTSLGTPLSGPSHPHDFIGSAFLPSAAFRYRLSDRWAVGLTVSTPFGETTNYPSDWVGRYYAQTTNLITLNVTPVVSWQATPDLTLAGGMQFQYAHAYLSEAIDFGTLGAINGFPVTPGGDDGAARIKGASWDYGYVLGAQWKALPQLTLGVSYRSGIDQNLKGHESFVYDTGGVAATLHALTGAFTNSGASADLPLPATINAGARYDVDPQWSVMAGLEYTDWGRFNQIVLQSNNPANPADLLDTNWHGTWFGSLGVEYRPDSQWAFRAGTGYDNAATPDANVVPRIPDAQRYWLSTGVGYRWDQHTDINFAVSHLFTPSSRIDQNPLQPGNALRGSLQGVSNTDATLVALELVYR
ncbi:MAG: outer membrane protein transport protein [Rhizomicrobium sp.]